MLARTAVLLSLAACGQGGARAPNASPAIAPIRYRLALPVNGLSGLTRDGNVLWSVAERGQTLVALSTDGRVQRTLPIAGLPDGYDLESVARLDAEHLALGSEVSAERWQSPEGKSLGKIFVVELSKGEAHVVSTIDLPFSLWGVQPEENQGIEGLCHTGDHLLAGIETVATEHSRRFAPLAARTSSGHEWHPYLLALTSSEGKLSSLDCRSVGDSIDVVAVERHFGVMRILRFTIGPGQPRIIEPTLLADLSDFVAPDSLNIEGIVRLDDGGFAMIVDNSFKTITGPNELIVLPVGSAP